jgi:hypothetical protein
MNDLQLIISITKNEYNGFSFNGPNLRKTLKSLSFSQIISTDTYEKYSVWGIVLHLMKWKHTLAGLLGAQDLLPFPYGDEDFPQLPQQLTEEAWENTLVEMDIIHKQYLLTLADFDPEKLEEKMTWGCTYGEAITWMTTHDTYHLAQIRNMGLEIVDA